MSGHPYRAQPGRAFWSRSVAAGFDPLHLTAEAEYFQPDDRVVTAGSCFAANLIPYLDSSEAEYVRTERLPRVLADMDDNLGYRTFSAAYGNIYTPRHLRQLLERAYGLFAPVEDRWYEGSDVVDPFRPGLRYPASSDEEFDLLTAQHLGAVREAMEAATVLVFTLGLTEAWEAIADGAVYPACPGTVRGTFDPTRHRFVNFTVSQIRDDLIGAIGLLREHNPACRVILTVSPVPLVATATGDHVLSATIYSKSVLRAAAGEVVGALDGVAYFPAYEIVTGPQAPEAFFEANRRDVSLLGVRTVMSALFGQDLVDYAPAGTKPQPAPDLPVTDLAQLSQRLTSAECDEALQEG